ncbi:MAG: sugar ABC transporter substrate-binding protein [Spirochaetales bacterium]|nr:MAG: sugar ABC transporter substrate-binding protein [Spirochaetales bacterium]
MHIRLSEIFSRRKEKMRNTRKVLVALFVALFVLGSMVSVFAAGKQEPAGAMKAEKKLNLVFVTPLIAHPVWDVARAGFEDGLKQYGVTGQYVGPQGIDPAEMVNQIELALVSGADGIISMPIAPTAMRPVFKKAAEKGVPVIFVGAEDPESTALAFIGTNEANLGKMGAEGIKKYYAAKGNPPLFAYIQQSTMDASFAIKARDGYLAALKDYAGGFKMVLNEPNNSDMVTAMQKMETAFKAYPEINLVIGVAGEVGSAAAKVVKEMGLQSKITIIAIDDIAETMDWLKQGVITGVMAQNFYKMGNLGVKFLVDYLKDGKKPAQFSNDSGSIFVTKDNITTYTEALKK